MRRLSLLLALVPLAFGCGAEEKDGLSASAGAVKDAGSSRIDMTLTENDKPIYTATGYIDYARGLGRFGMSWGAESSSPSDIMEGRYIGQTMWFGWRFGEKMRWLESDDEGEPTGSEEFLPGPGGTTPERILSVLRASSKEVEEVGREEVRGVETTHYRAHLDPQKYELYSDGEPTEQIVDAWVDEAGLARRLSMPEGAGTMTFELFDFGVKVEVEAPPADEIVSEEEFNKLMQAECESRPKDRRHVLCEGTISEESGEESLPAETLELDE
jgi:hypothetical protein